jgi:hypothetical protein
MRRVSYGKSRLGKELFKGLVEGMDGFGQRSIRRLGETIEEREHRERHDTAGAVSRAGSLALNQADAMPT